jgi:hypothetical protein
VCLLYIAETTTLALWAALQQITYTPTEENLHKLIGSVYNGVILAYCFNDSDILGDKFEEFSALMCDHREIGARIETMHQKYAWAVHSYMEYVVPRMLIAINKSTTIEPTLQNSKQPDESLQNIALRPYYYFADKHALARSVYMSKWGKQECESYQSQLVQKTRPCGKATKPQGTLHVYGFLTDLHDAVIGSKHRYHRSIGLPWQLLPITTPKMQVLVQTAYQQANYLHKIRLANCFAFGNILVETRNITDGSVPGVESQ